MALATITVNCQPWANVTVNGRPAGPTPARVEVPAGTVRILLERGDRQSMTRVVHMGRGERRTFSFAFE